MASMTGQIVLAAGEKKSLAAGLQNTETSDTAFSLFFQQLIIQNNGSNSARLGDVTVDATHGIVLGASGSTNAGSFINYGSYIQDWFVFSTAGTTIDFLYVK